MMTNPHPAVSPNSLDIKAFHRKFPTGVMVVTVMDDGQPRGLALNAFTSITIEPAVIMVCVAHSSTTHDAMLRSKTFGLNVLANDQFPLAGVFASKAPDKFSAVEWNLGLHGSPLLVGACAQLEAQILSTTAMSTHTMFLGEVKWAAAGEHNPLLYLGSQFFDGAALSCIVDGESAE